MLKLCGDQYLMKLYAAQDVPLADTFIRSPNQSLQELNKETLVRVVNVNLLLCVKIKSLKTSGRSRLVHPYPYCVVAGVIQQCHKKTSRLPCTRYRREDAQGRGHIRQPFGRLGMECMISLIQEVEITDFSAGSSHQRTKIVCPFPH